MFKPTPIPNDFFFAGYIDPSAGHVFSSLGPVILSALGGGLGLLTLFFGRIKNFLTSLFKKKTKNDQPKEKNCHHRD